jgi:hypothetical protein
MLGHVPAAIKAIKLNFNCVVNVVVKIRFVYIELPVKLTT